MSNDKHTVYFELQEALAQEGCAICALVARGLGRYFEGLAYERVNDIRTRAEIRAALGFCPPHGRMLRESRAPLGSAIIHRDVIKNAGEALAASTRGGSVAAALRQAVGGRGKALTLEPQGACPACERRGMIEQTYIGLLVRELQEGRLLPALRASWGLCLPHLRLALGRTPDAEAFERLRATQLACWERLQTQLDTFVRKHDYRYTGEPIGEEANSWSLAVDLVSGIPGLVPPDDGR
jgi:hypothetical protein